MESLLYYFLGRSGCTNTFALFITQLVLKKCEAMTIRYFSHSKITFKTDECDLNILKTPQILQKLPVPNVIGSEDCLNYSFRNPPNF